MRAFLLSIFLFGTLIAKPLVLVTLPPQKFLVEALSGDACTVEVLVPPGASSHTYEPKAKQIDRIASASLFFRIGESFEEHIAPLVKKNVDLRLGLDLIGCRCHGGEDPHIWLSPKMLKIQVHTICSALEELLDQNLQDNLTKLLAQIEEVEKKLETFSYPKALIFSHPAFGYFCRDFGIEQLSVEMDGKEPSAKQLQQLVDQLTQKDVKRLFLQKQYSQKGGLAIASLLDLETEVIDPYAEDLLANLLYLGERFSDRR